MGESCPSFAYLVTAKHVIDGIRKKGSPKVLLRANFKDGQARWIETATEHWQFHPTDPSVDVAVFNATGNPSAHLDHGVWPIDTSATRETVLREEIGLGEETVIVGLFAPHHGDARNIPIVRIGTIAAMPEETIVTNLGGIEGYLIECRSIGGLSGSPVFVNLGTTEGFGHVPGKKRPVGRLYLLGLMHGHYDADAVNMGVGIVVPADKINEVLNQESIVTLEQAARDKAKLEMMPTMDVLENESRAAFSRDDFESALRKVSRRLQPSQSDEEK